jgi:dihydroorotate dehydrogenase (NAD+) catalytic subunit
MKPVDLSVRIAGVRLPNPVVPASGTYELSDAHEGFFSPAELGAVINKTIFREPRTGNPPPRIWETPSGMLNAIGIPSKGLRWFLDEELPRMRRLGPPVIASVAGGDIAEFAEVAGAVGASGQADLLELDLSCPNLGDGILWATDPDKLQAVLAAVRAATSLPVIAKLSPNVQDIAAMAAIAEEAGAAAVSMVNTFQGMAVDIRSRRPALGNLTGGLSGPAIRPLAVYAVYSTFQKVRIPIIGMGGITCWEDAVEFLLAGATAVAVGTQNFVNPLVMLEVIEGLRRYLEHGGFASVRDIIGLAH